MLETKNGSGGHGRSEQLAGKDRGVVDPRIAVLPFDNTSNDSNQDYLGEGLAAELLICLARIPGLHLIARSAVFSIPQEQRNRLEIQRQLHATDVLRGGVTLLNDELSVTVDLIDVESGRSRWSGQYNRMLDDVFVMLDEIAAGVSEALELGSEHGQIRSIQSLHSSDVEAYDRYLRGRQAYFRYSKHGIQEALQLFQDAIGLDPKYALAYAGAADCYSYLYMYVESSASNMSEAERFSRHALELDSDLAEAHASLGLALSLLGRYSESEEAFVRAVELDPKLFEAHYFYARTCFAQGNMEKAIEQFDEARRARPEDYQSPLLMGQVYDSLNQPQPARAVREEGVLVAERHLDLNPGDARALYMGANGYVALGKMKKGLEWLEEALRLEPTDAMLLYNAGCIYALLDMPNEAFDCLERTVAGGLTQKEWYEHDSNLDSLRADPRFEALLEAMG